MASRMNWWRAGKERIISKNGHERLSAYDKSAPRKPQKGIKQTKIEERKEKLRLRAQAKAQAQARAQELIVNEEKRQKKLMAEQRAALIKERIRRKELKILEQIEKSYDSISMPED